MKKQHYNQFNNHMYTMINKQVSQLKPFSSIRYSIMSNVLYIDITVKDVTKDKITYEVIDNYRFNERLTNNVIGTLRFNANTVECFGGCTDYNFTGFTVGIEYLSSDIDYIDYI